MNVPTTASLADLYLSDEIAWYDAMAELARQRRAAEFDYDNLAELLTDMGIRERRGAESRLITLIAHRLKIDFQPEKLTRSWQITVERGRQKLVRILDSRTLWNHVTAELPAIYADAIRLAAVETGLPRSAFPVECPYPLAELLAEPAE